MLRIVMLGGFEFWWAEENRPLPATAKARSLLAYLITNRDRAWPREQLASLFWGDRPDHKARQSLATALWDMRRCLPDEKLLAADTQSVQFDPQADLWLDTEVFESFVANDDPAALEAARELYRGDFLESYYDDWVIDQRYRLQGLFGETLGRLMAIYEAQGDDGEALANAQKLIEQEPLHEEAHRLAMRSYDRLGQRNAALRQYRRCRELVLEELGIEPMAETTELYQAILKGPSDPRAPAGAPSAEAGPAPGTPPFKGLQFFGVEDAALFFGRGAWVSRLVDHVQQNRFLAVVGASGSGKSSVVRAGLIPALLANSPVPKKSGGLWSYCLLSPTSDPLAALADGLLARKNEEADPADRAALVALLKDDLARNPDTLRKTIGQGSGHLLLVVDQFEELFTLCRRPADRQAFVANLLIAACDKEGATTVVIALRADFYAHCAQFDEFREQLVQNQVYLGQMSQEELRRAIEEPARARQWTIEPGLVDLIQRDMGNEPGALPLLSHVLLETWARRRGRTLTLAGYNEAGGVQGAIALTADRVYQGLTPEQQAIARNIFLRLTELGEGTHDTRRRATLGELVPLNGERPAMESVLATLVDARLVITAENRAEVAHEALIREWPALRRWLNDNREDLRLHRHLTETAQEWERLGRPADDLYRGARLEGALEWAEQQPAILNALEQEFLRASLNQAQERAAEREARHRRELAAAQALAEEQRKVAVTEKRRAEEQIVATTKFRRGALVLSGVSLATILLALTAFLLFRQARQNEQLATSRELAAAAINNLEVDPELSVLLALEAMAAADTREAQNALHQSLPALHLIRTFIGHSNIVASLALSPDGQLLATGSQDHTLKIWQLSSGRELLNLDFPGAAVRALAFSPDGRRLATAGFAMPFNIWGLAPDQSGNSLTARALITITAQTEPVLALAFSPNGSLLASGDNAALVRIWDAGNGQELFNLAGHEPTPSAATIGLLGVNGVAFSPKGQFLATAGTDGTTRVWDTGSGEELLVIPGHTQAARAVAFSPDGSRLAAAGEEGMAKIWSLSPGASEAETQLVISEPDGLNTVVFSPDGSTLATAGMDGKVKIWDAQSGQELLALVGHSGSALLAVFSPDGEKLVTTSEDGTARVWDTRPGRELLVLTPGTSPAYSPDGEWLATGNADGTITIREADSGEAQLTLPGHGDMVVSAAFSPDSRQLATASRNGTAKVWEVESGQELFDLAGHEDRLWDITFSPDGTLIATAGSDHTFKIWDAATGRELRTVRASDSAVFSVDFSPDGSHLASGNWGEAEGDSVKLWDVASGQLLWTVPIEDGVYDVAFDPSGERLAISHRSDATLWDVTADEPQALFSFDGHASSVIELEFNSDGGQLASASFDGTARLWDTATGQELLTLTGQSDPLVSVAFSADGDRLATASMNQTTHVYTLDPHELVDLAMARLTRSLSDEECRRFLHRDPCPD